MYIDVWEKKVVELTGVSTVSRGCQQEYRRSGGQDVRRAQRHRRRHRARRSSGHHRPARAFKVVRARSVQNITTGRTFPGKPASAAGRATSERSRTDARAQTEKKSSAAKILGN